MKCLLVLYKLKDARNMLSLVGVPSTSLHHSCLKIQIKTIKFRTKLNLHSQFAD